jgi:hypothetical protein
MGRNKGQQKRKSNKKFDLIDKKSKKHLLDFGEKHPIDDQDFNGLLELLASAKVCLINKEYLKAMTYLLSSIEYKQDFKSMLFIYFEKIQIKS